MLESKRLVKRYFGAPTFGDAQLAETPVSLDERRWGYILNAPGRSYLQMNMMQRVSVFVAAYLLSYTFSCLVAVATGLNTSVDILCVAASGLVGLLALPFIWFATRGTQAYIYINTYRNELREVVPNLIGKPTVLRRVPFRDIGGVRIDHGGAGERAVLLLRQGSQWRRVAILEGGRRGLTSLREKLAKDVFSEQLAATRDATANTSDLSLIYRTDSVQRSGIA